MTQRTPRSAWVRQLVKLATPVLDAAAQRRLKAAMPVETTSEAAAGGGRSRCTHLEAVGRLLAGLAPWLSRQATDPEERAQQQRLSRLALETLDAISDPDSPDFLMAGESRQNLVDTAFLCQGLLRAPAALWEPLDERVKRHLIDGTQAVRHMVPGANNWLLFRSMVEAWRCRVGVPFDVAGIRLGVEMHAQWYKGDGVYGDGREFHWDYYNSFVIQPMLVDIVEVMGDHDSDYASLRPRIVERARRYAAVQERMIAPDGSFPVLGRSMCYRGGAFQTLAMMALRKQLPEGLEPAAVREALTAVINRTMGPPGTFDDDGWLRIGLAGHQPSLGENYISTGSLYLCSTTFLPLGLPEGDPFWSDPPADWTARRAWAGHDLPRDAAYKEPL